MQDEWGDCDHHQDDITSMSFDENTGILSFQTVDQDTYPPGFLYFTIEVRIETFAISATYVIELIDPCISQI